MKKQPKVNIIILNWNGFEDTKECINSLEKIDYLNYKIFLLDNGSKTDSNKIKNYYKNKKNIQLLFSKKNLGFTGGNNYVIKKLLGKDEYILLLNNDTTVGKKFLSNLIKTYEKDPKIGIAAPIIRDYKTKEIDFAGGEINWWLGRPYHLKKFERENTNFITGCCMLIRIKNLKKVGLFDNSYFAYFEDADLCERFKEKGYILKISKKSKIYHKISRSTNRRGIYNYYFARNRLIFNQKYNYGIKKIFFIILQKYIKRILAKIIMNKEDYKYWLKGLNEAKK